jgi:DNA polymerase delta subunit 2
VAELQEDIPSYEIDDTKKTYKHQYSNIYYMRLQLLRSFVQARAKAKWRDIAGSPFPLPATAIVRSTRILDRQPALC